MTARRRNRGRSGARAGVPSRLSLGAATVRQASCNAVRAATALALLCAWGGSAQAADPGKVLRVEFYVAETGFDPVKVQDYYSQTVAEAIFEPLMTYDYLARPAKLAPRAAESMPVVSEQAKTYVFKIRKGVYFSADPAFKGKKRELTAEDYVYTIKRFRIRPINHRTRASSMASWGSRSSRRKPKKAAG